MRTAPTALALLAAAVLALPACTAGPQRPAQEWTRDEDSGLYYREGLVAQSDDPIREHLPELTGYSAVTWTDGRLTDPEGREALPAPDDAWWQAVVDLEPEEAAQLSGAAPPVGEDEVRARIVPPLEQALRPCTGTWQDVTTALAAEGTTDITAAGDLLDLAVLCPDTGQLVLDARDM